MDPRTTSRLLRWAADTFRPAAEPIRPAALRLGVGGFTAWSAWRRREMFRRLHRQDASQFSPTGVVRVLRRPLPHRVADALYDAAQVANLLATVGAAHRITGPLNAALQLWTLSYRNSWGMIFHNDNQMVGHLMVLGLSPSAHALSADELVRSGRLAPRRLERRYGAVAPALNVVTASVYLISGVAKVRSPRGWRWAGGSTLRDQIGADAVRKEVFGSEAPRAAGMLYRSRGPLGALAVLALLVELGAPAALLERRTGQAFSVAAWGMHLGIRVVMGIRFTYNLSGVSYLGFFPVGRQRPAVRSWIPWQR